MNSLNTLTLSYIQTRSNECIITNLVGLFKNTLDIKTGQANYHNLSNVNFLKISSNLKSEYLSNSNFNIYLAKEFNNSRYFSTTRQFKKHFIFKNNNVNIIQRKIEEKKFLHSLVEENSDTNEIIHKTPIKYEGENSNTIKTNSQYQVENNSDLEKQNEVTININEKNSDILKQKTSLIDNSECILKHLPNILCISRILTSPVIGYLIVKHKMKQACFLYAISGITDFLDGYLARKYKWTSKLGSVIDPLADKILMIVSTISLSIVKLLPKYLAFTILGRDIFLLFGSFFLVAKKFIDTGSTFSQIKNFKMKVKPSYISKVNTTLQIILLTLTILSPELNFIKILQGLVFSTTLFSGMDYVINRNAIEISFDKINEEKQNSFQNNEQNSNQNNEK